MTLAVFKVFVFIFDVRIKPIFPASSLTLSWMPNDKKYDTAAVRIGKESVPKSIINNTITLLLTCN